jgi:transposase
MCGDQDMRAYSHDLRERIVRAVASGQPMTTTAQRFDVSVKTVQRWVRRYEQTGTVAPRPIPGLPRHLDAAGDRQLQERLTTQPDATVLENCAWWTEVSGRAVSETTMWRAMHRVGWTHKKKYRSK